MQHKNIEFKYLWYFKSPFLLLFLGLWAVVNNAGIQVVGEVEFCTMDIYHKVAEVNMFGMVRMTKAFLPLIRKNKGTILLIISKVFQTGMSSLSVFVNYRKRRLISSFMTCHWNSIVTKVTQWMPV
jgi:NAD(P)-dependent dehydrogenase (short-subunit alcohol dehydrogenase family)